MWKTFLVVLVPLLMLASPRAEWYSVGSGMSAGAQQRSESVIPLEGLDPVLLTRGKEAQGDERFSVTRGRFRYLFAGAETKAAFERDPSLYEIQLGGTCARMGPDVTGNPDIYLVRGGRIYIFGSPDCLKAFQANPESFLEAGAPASTPAPASDEARRRGAALIEKAVEAAGGAARVDGVVSYEERGTVQGGRAGQIKMAVLALYPNRISLERTLPFGTLATVVTAEGGFVLTPRQTAELVEEQRAAFLKQFRRGLLPLLHARRDRDFTAVAAGPGKMGEAPVEQVDVAFGGVSVRVGIDPATGRVLGLSYRGRSAMGAFGQIVRTFSDFRSVGGLTLPFKTEGTFDGAPDPSQSSAVESIVINGEVTPALFERPKPAGGQ